MPVTRSSPATPARRAGRSRSRFRRDRAAWRPSSRSSTRAALATARSVSAGSSRSARSPARCAMACPPTSTPAGLDVPAVRARRRAAEPRQRSLPHLRRVVPAHSPQGLHRMGGHEPRRHDPPLWPNQNSRIVAPSGNVARWLLSSIMDPFGNEIKFDYDGNPSTPAFELPMIGNRTTATPISRESATDRLGARRRVRVRVAHRCHPRLRGRRRTADRLSSDRDPRREQRFHAQPVSARVRPGRYPRDAHRGTVLDFPKSPFLLDPLRRGLRFDDAARGLHPRERSRAAGTGVPLHRSRRRQRRPVGHRCLRGASRPFRRAVLLAVTPERGAHRRCRWRRARRHREGRPEHRRDERSGSTRRRAGSSIRAGATRSQGFSLERPG